MVFIFATEMILFIIVFVSNRVIMVFLFSLYVVSTAVGGIPEVLPTDFIKLVPANSFDLIDAMISAVYAVHKQRTCENVSFYDDIKNFESVS